MYANIMSGRPFAIRLFYRPVLRVGLTCSGTFQAYSSLSVRENKGKEIKDGKDITVCRFYVSFRDCYLTCDNRKPSNWGPSISSLQPSLSMGTPRIHPTCYFTQNNDHPDAPSSSVTPATPSFVERLTSATLRA